MKRFVLFLTLTLALAVLVGVATPALAAVSGSDLIERPKAWDGKPVTYQGEVIGEVMRRGSVAVLNVLNHGYAMGVWVPVRLAEQVRFAGRYGVKGDLIEVQGVYHRACPEHGGDPDIHAESLTVVTPGSLSPEPFHEREAYGAALLLVLALILVFWENRRRVPEVVEEEY